jgi:hypothetical protein
MQFTVDDDSRELVLSLDNLWTRSCICEQECKTREHHTLSQWVQCPRGKKSLQGKYGEENEHLDRNPFEYSSVN